MQTDKREMKTDKRGRCRQIREEDIDRKREVYRQKKRGIQTEKAAAQMF